MQFRSLLLLAAVVAAVSAQGNYGKTSSSSDYGKSSSTTDYGKSSTSDYGKSSTSDYGKSSTSDYGKTTTDAYSSGPAYGDSGYDKKFAAPPFWVRWGNKLKSIKKKIKSGATCIAHAFHQKWINLKSDLDRIKYWLTCEINHFKHWYDYKCAVEQGKKKIRSALQQKYYDAMCKLEKDYKDDYHKRVAECKSVTSDGYGEEDDDYVQSTTTEEYSVSQKYDSTSSSSSDYGKSSSSSDYKK